MILKNPLDMHLHLRDEEVLTKALLEKLKNGLYKLK